MFVSKPIDEITPSLLKDFSCGEIDLDIYLKRFAKTNHKKGIGKTFVFLNECRVVGFYTVSMASIEFCNIPARFQLGIPKYPIPVARIGRLAVDTGHQGKMIGRQLLIDALKRILDASRSIAAYGIIVNAKSDKAKIFYEKFGFMSFENEPLSLYLPIMTVIDLFES